MDIAEIRLRVLELVYRKDLDMNESLLRAQAAEDHIMRGLDDKTSQGQHTLSLNKGDNRNTGRPNR